MQQPAPEFWDDVSDNEEDAAMGRGADPFLVQYIFNINF